MNDTNPYLEHRATPTVRDELAELLNLTGMLNETAKEANAKLQGDSATKMAVRGINPQAIISKVMEKNPNIQLPPTPTPPPMVKVMGVDGNVFEVRAPIGLIPMDDIPRQIITGSAIQNPSPVISTVPQVPKNQQEFLFVDNLNKKVPIAEEIIEMLKIIEFRMSSIDSRIKKIEEYLLNRKKRLT